MERRKISIVILIAIVHMIMASTFLSFGFSLTGSGSSLGMVGFALFALAFVMMLPMMLLSYFHIPTLSDIPLWEGSLGDYFGGMDYPLIFLNSLLWAMVIYSLWNRVRNRS